MLDSEPKKTEEEWKADATIRKRRATLRTSVPEHGNHKGFPCIKAKNTGQVSILQVLIFTKENKTDDMKSVIVMRSTASAFLESLYACTTTKHCLVHAEHFQGHTGGQIYTRSTSSLQ